MKITEIVEAVNHLKPHPYTEDQILFWLNHCEMMVQTDIFLFAPVEVIGYSWPEDANAELLVSPPYDKLYLSYLYAMIDFANGEYDKYQNSMQMFNSDFSEFTGWFASTYHPADTNLEGGIA